MTKDVMKVCCFTGHRPSKFEFKYNEAHPDCMKIKEMLKAQIEKAISEGFNYFIAGGALGVDTWAANIILELRSIYKDIKLEIAVPCKNQEKTWPETSKKEYRKILKVADIVHFVSEEEYKPQLMILRDQYMVDKSTLLIAIFDGSSGGTKHTVDYAKGKNIEIRRINSKTFRVSTTKEKTEEEKLILECSTKGDKRFSSLCANVDVFGKSDTIEKHYQLSKRFGDEVPATWKDAKGKIPTHFSVNGCDYDAKYLTAWFKLLWAKYLDNNPDLVEYAKGFNDYHDMFKGKNSINCQADVIRQYVKEGRSSIIAECHDLLELFRENIIDKNESN